MGKDQGLGIAYVGVTLRTRYHPIKKSAEGQERDFQKKNKGGNLLKEMEEKD